MMLVTKTLEDVPKGGRQLLCRLNHDALAEIFGDRLVVCELTHVTPRGLGAIRDIVRGHIDGVTGASVASTLARIEASGVSSVFVDGSNLGALAREIRKRFPRIRILTFFHNVEARFFLGALKHRPTARALAVLAANYLAERMAVQSSDRILVLTQRDGRLLQKLYHRRETDVVPMAMRERIERRQADKVSGVREPYALFVGGAFYANVDGVAWFAKEVAPHVGMQTWVVGRGFERFKAHLERTRNINVVGAVDDLGPWYRNAVVVIAPIFDGSGMNTKVAEAMLFGKRVLGTPQAFAGYEEVAAMAGRVCRSAAEFRAAMSEFANQPPPVFDEKIRALFDQRFSFEAHCARLRSIVGEAV